MADRARLRALLDRIEGRSYPSYRDLHGEWHLGDLTVIVDHVQGDPFAAPSRVRVVRQTGISAAVCTDADKRIAAEDWLLRRFVAGLGGSKRGSGRSGELRVYSPGPEVVQRSTVRLHPDGRAEVRFTVGLPARGRRVLGHQAFALLTEDVALAAACLREADGMDEHIQSVIDQGALRVALQASGLVAFIADGAVLPRQSGVSQAPMAKAVRFQSPPSMRCQLNTPSGPVSGMGIAVGVTLIVGGGFHGKSTLLNAIQRGHLNHIPGDGREQVVTIPDGVKVRAEDGRRVCGVDISPFLRTLPGGRSTRPFQSDDASGSTSQAAAIIEAVESGATALLLDEDTSATNLLVRDERMRALVPSEHEPITPFVERIRQLYESWGVSTVLVVGGVGDYLAVADSVVGMVHYLPHDLTERAQSLAGAAPEPPGPLPERAPRFPSREGLAPGKIRARDERRVDYGRNEIDLMAVEQVLDGAHAATLGHALGALHDVVLGKGMSMKMALDALDSWIEKDGIDVLSPRRYPVGELIRPRRHEVAATLNRLRSLGVEKC